MVTKSEIKERIETGYHLITKCKLFRCLAEDETSFQEGLVSETCILELALLFTAVAPGSFNPAEPLIFHV